MSKHYKKNAVALFGSAARGDNDVFSDRDLLVISGDEPTLRRMKGKYDSEGWSCTAYTWKRLQSAADKGSLFVQHLKQESKILWDPSDQLAHLLEQYSPKADYKQEMSGATGLIGNLMQHLPRCPVGPMWTLDVLAVGFRSLAVARLADDGIYAFSNNRIVDELIRIGVAGREDGTQLNDLRRFKSLYRKGLQDSRIGWAHIFDWIRLVDRTFTLGLDSHVVEDLELIDLALREDTSTKSTSDWYVRCRRIESVLWTLRPRQDKVRAEFRERRDRLLKLVRSPNSYAWHFTRGHKTVQSNLSDLLQICAV